MWAVGALPTLGTRRAADPAQSLAVIPSSVLTGLQWTDGLTLRFLNDCSGRLPCAHLMPSSPTLKHLLTPFVCCSMGRLLS